MQTGKTKIITRSEHAIKKTPTSTFFYTYISFTLLFIRWRHFALAYRERKQRIPLFIVPFGGIFFSSSLFEDEKDDDDDEEEEVKREKKVVIVYPTLISFVSHYTLVSSD